MLRLGGMSTSVYTDAKQRRLLQIIPDLISNRDLLLDLVWRELQARYRNAMMGLLWAVLQPVMLMFILTFVFGYVLPNVANRANTMGHTFAVFLLCGLVPWQFMAVTVAGAPNALVGSQELIKKVYFPREIITIAGVVNCLINLFIGFITLLVVMLILEGYCPTAGLLYVPIIFAIEFALVLGLSFIFSASNVFYRDTGYLVDISLAFGFYATPIFYPLPSKLSPWLYKLYMLNPMAHLLQAYREALLLNQFPSWQYLAYPAVVAVLVLFLGMVYFRRNAPTFADYL
jgi:lipopolysaccharide transport system permease protein